MSSPIILVGATGNLGSRVLQELVALQAQVRCLVRKETPQERVAGLRAAGADVIPVDFGSIEQLRDACRGGAVVVSTVSGLEDVIVGLQSRLLEAAISAGVPRFIPSDFSIDYRQIAVGENRNLNLRETFREVLDRHPDRIRVTSILNGAFMNMLTGTAPFILFPIRRILCWGDPDQLMDWTTIGDTARYTANAAMDSDTPRYLKIAGEEISARGLSALMTELTGREHRLLRPGGPGVLKALIAMTKLCVPGGDEIYPPWQGMQYMHNMYLGKCKFTALDHARYPMKFTTVRQVLSAHLG
jgi:nucleoside-diphosphate-sugar epimerase